MRLARKFYDLARNDSRFEVVGKATMGLVCFRLKAPSLNNKNGKQHANDMLSIQVSIDSGTSRLVRKKLFQVFQVKRLELSRQISIAETGDCKGL